jgi:Phage tail-collar fibre protein/Chaperone of endosialidase
MTADVFIVTQVGLDNSTSAAESGIVLQLATFKVGSAYGYNPNKSDTALHGSVLYTANITSFSTASDGSLVVNCVIDVNAGPFDFGEVGIYTTSGVLFALMALPEVEHKYSALGSNVASTFTFQCYLRLGQAGGVIEIVTGSSGGGSGTSNFVYTPQSGQPVALWGSSDGGVDSYVWNPSNFNVATAKGITTSGAAVYNATTHTWYAANGTTELAALDGSGNFTASNLGTFSDMRFKHNVAEISDSEALDIVMQMYGITYELKDDESGRRYPGTSAQAMQKLFPVGVIDNGSRLALLYPQIAVALFPSAMRAMRDEFNSTISDLRAEVNSMKGLMK